MNKSILILLSFCIHLSFQCSKDDECNNPHGICQNNKCLCQTFYGGKDCTEKWQDNPTWNVLYWIHASSVLLVHTCVVVFIGRQLFITFRYAELGKWTTWNVNIASLASVLLGSILRVIGFSVDPNGIRGTLGNPTEYIIFNIAILLYFQAAMMVFFYWVELQQTKGSLTFVSEYRPALVSLVVFITVLEICITIWRAIVQTVFAAVIQNIFYILLFITLIVLSSWGGISLLKIMKKSSTFRVTTSSLDAFGRKLLTYVVLSDAVWITQLITVAVYVGVGPTSSQWLWLPCHYLFRTQEVLAIALFLSFLKKKKPSEESVQSTGSGVTMSLRVHPRKSGETENTNQIDPTSTVVEVNNV